MNFRAFLIVSLLAGGLLAGCGSKGPLYLPGKAPGSTKPIPGSETSPDSDGTIQPNPQRTLP